ncbi:hypothetical protein Dimus_009669 [Dionaea muscipula]
MTNKRVSTSPKKKSGPAGNGACRKCGIVGIGGRISSNKEGFKKGPWTVEEDALLMEYVRNHGERHWNCVQKTGLMRCGKSCRLRWTNHLRPDLKKGAFNPEEERIVLQLHAQLGNRWSKIASELPGRTDNEVKNFWNTKIKRKMRIDSLIEPENHENDYQQQQEAFAFYLEHQNNHQAQAQAQAQRDSSSIPSSPSFTSLFSPTSFDLPSLDPYMPLSDPRNYTIINPAAAPISTTSMQNDPILAFLNNPAYKFKYHLQDEEEYYDDQVNGTSTPSFSSVPFLQGLSLPFDTLHSSSLTPDYGYPVGLADNGLELPSNQIHIPSGDSSGHVQSYQEMNSRRQAAEDVEAMDDDLSSLLHNFSTIECPPEWYLTGKNMLNSQYKEEAASSSVPATTATTTSITQGLEYWTEGAYCWNNMPGIH